MTEETRVLAKLADYTIEMFQPLIGQTFCFVRQDGVRVELELLEVRSTKVRATRQGRQGFSLLFSLRGTGELDGGLLRLDREGFDPEAWFVNRVAVLGGDPDVAYCEAVFS
jgi:hypothetical protein